MLRQVEGQFHAGADIFAPPAPKNWASGNWLRSRKQVRTRANLARLPAMSMKVFGFIPNVRRDDVRSL